MTITARGVSGGCYFRFDDGVAAPVSPVDTGQIRYNNVTKEFEQSIDGVAWTGFGGGPTSPWDRTGTVTHLVDVGDQVGIGTATPVASTKVNIVDANNTTHLYLGVPGTVQPIVQLSSLHASSVTWNILTYSAIPGGPDDHGFRIGWNVAQNGERVVAGEPAFYDSWDSNYPYISGQGHFWRSWEYFSGDGLTYRRPLAGMVNRSTSQSHVDIAGRFKVYDSTGVQQRFLINDDPLLPVPAIFNNAYISVEPNNVPAFRQLNSLSTSYQEIARINASDQVQIAGAGNQTSVRGQLTVQTGAGQAWTDVTAVRGLMLVEANTTRWNLAPMGSVTTLESALSLTIAGSRELGMSVSSGVTPDCVTSRHSVSLAPNTAAGMLVITMAANSSVAFEFELSCKNTTGSVWGHFKKSCIIVRNGAAAPVVASQSTLYMQRSSADFEPFFFVNPTTGGVYATSNAVAPTLQWVGTITRIVQL